MPHTPGSKAPLLSLTLWILADLGTGWLDLGENGSRVTCRILQDLSLSLPVQTCASVQTRNSAAAMGVASRGIGTAMGTRTARTAQMRRAAVSACDCLGTWALSWDSREAMESMNRVPGWDSLPTLLLDMGSPRRPLSGSISGVGASRYGLSGGHRPVPHIFLSTAPATLPPLQPQQCPHPPATWRNSNAPMAAASWISTTAMVTTTAGTGQTNLIAVSIERPAGRAEVEARRLGGPGRRDACGAGHPCQLGQELKG